MKTIYNYRVRAMMKGGYPSFQPDGKNKDIPGKFYGCERRWNKIRQKSLWPKNDFAFVKAAIEPQLTAKLWLNDYQMGSGIVGYAPFDASSVELIDASFEDGPMPVINACAYFDIMFTERLENEQAFNDWSEKYGRINDCVKLYFKFTVGTSCEIIRADDNATWCDVEMPLLHTRSTYNLLALMWFDECVQV